MDDNERQGPYEWRGDDRPKWDAEFADELLGSRVLVGITHIDPDGAGRLDQFFGVVSRVDPNDGVVIDLEGTRSGEQSVLPPHLDAFLHAAPGEYRLRSSGEIVADPDYTSVWTIHGPAKQ